MKLPWNDYVELGFMTPAFAFRWFIRRREVRLISQEDRAHQMLQYLLLMGFEHDGYNVSTYDDEGTRHVFWVGNWPYAYGDYSIVYQGERGVEIVRYTMTTASLRNVILCRKLDRSKWKTRTAPCRSTPIAVLKAWGRSLAGWLGLKGR